MKRNDFWFFSLTVLFTFAVALHWPRGLRLAVIANSLIILFQVGKTVREVYHDGK